MKKEKSETPDMDGIYRHAGMLNKLSKSLDAFFALRSLGDNGKEDQVKT